MHVYYQVKHRVQAPTLARKFDISHWFPFGAGGRADRRTYRHVIAKICRMDRLPNLLRYGTPLALGAPPKTPGFPQ